jgi:O-antigen/teichoic acid export membrane protein
MDSSSSLASQIDLQKGQNKLIDEPSFRKKWENGLSISENFLWIFFGNIVYSCSQWGILILLAKLGSPEIVGQFVLALAITTPVIIFSNMGLRSVQATDAKYEFIFANYFGLRLFTTFFALLLIVGIALISGYRIKVTILIMIVAVAKAIESISDVFFGLLQKNERMDRIGKSLMIKGPLSLVGMGVGIYFTENIFWGAFGLAIAWIVILLSYDIRSAILINRKVTNFRGFTLSEFRKEKLLWPKWEINDLLRLSWIALPLGIVGILDSLKYNLPRYIIEGILGERELGIFAAIAYIMVAGNTIVLALGQSCVPRLAKYYALKEKGEFSKLLVKLLGIGLMLGCGGVIVAIVYGNEILTLLYGSEYAMQKIFVWLMAAAGVTYLSSFMGFGLTAARYFRSQMVLLLFVIIFLTLTCLWLIPSWNLLGGAVAIFCSASVHVIGSSLILIHAFLTIRIKPQVN